MLDRTSDRKARVKGLGGTSRVALVRFDVSFER